MPYLALFRFRSPLLALLLLASTLLAFPSPLHFSFPCLTSPLLASALFTLACPSSFHLSFAFPRPSSLQLSLPCLAPYLFSSPRIASPLFTSALFALPCSFSAQLTLLCLALPRFSSPCLASLLLASAFLGLPHPPWPWVVESMNCRRQESEGIMRIYGSRQSEGSPVN